MRGEGRRALLTDARRLERKALPRLVDRLVALAVPRGHLIPHAAGTGAGAQRRQRRGGDARPDAVDAPPDRDPLPWRRIWPRETLAGGAFHRARAPPARRWLCGVAARLAERSGRGDADCQCPCRRARSHRPHRSGHGDRPVVAGLDRGQQRFGPDARGGSSRPAADRAVRLVIARLHAAVVAASPTSPRSTSFAAPAFSANVRSVISSACAS